ncbi:MAG: nucleoside triphosphate pyrophosphohydrolase family protein [Flammeovirgaceae bacterium]
MQTPDSLNDVAQFHHTFNVPIEANPIIPNEERCNLRINLLEEELKELKQAIANKDLVEIADAFCDLQYVLSGAILEFGLGEKFKMLFDEVHRSNMSKVCKTLEEAEKTVIHYQTQKGMDGIIERKGKEYLVYRKSDNKVLKSINYSPANLKSILEK